MHVYIYIDIHRHTFSYLFELWNWELAIFHRNDHIFQGVPWQNCRTYNCPKLQDIHRIEWRNFQTNLSGQF